MLQTYEVIYPLSQLENKIQAYVWILPSFLGSNYEVTALS